ncbi:JAB domain-containing protein (plasmid) [Aquimarina sp. TRL1]|uniref:JAB domain-containing protein n=1 Tax=Aquimarina sp. (strain TRL1) TaxID=2736252 RepID=UPI00158894AD|nr:JAB domain-containing protein [Aquimarina sp. TRL1]QKX07782.1 JAB domain-containing protein [Aquimarina sp. TRL1]
MERIRTYRDYIGQLSINYRRTLKPTEKITSSLSAANFIRPYFIDFIDDHEEVKVIHLNRSSNVVNVHNAASGSDSNCLVPIKEILVSALHIKTSSIILVHNHPSGNIYPSNSDIKLSKKLKAACELIDIILLDSIIITRESYYSLSDEFDLE